MPALQTEDLLDADWQTCALEGCIGVQLEGQECCLGHVDEVVREAFLGALESEAELDLRGTAISSRLLTELLAALKVNGTPTLTGARFQRAQFSGAVDFAEARFSGDAEFMGAQFSGDADFKGAQFSGDVQFAGAQFSGDADFEGARFSGRAGFAWARFSRDAYFTEAQFSGDAQFGRAQFGGSAWFMEALFSGRADFGGAQFIERAVFTRAQFSNAGFLGPLLANTALFLDGAVFDGPLLLQAVSPQLSCVGATFKDAATLRLLFTEITLEQASFAKRSTISFAEDLKANFESTGRRDRDLPARPRLLSLRRVDVSTLVLADLDLSACLFEGAHNLDKLSLEGPPPFAYSPGPWRLRLSERWLPVWRRWSRRQTLAEEHQWRASASPPPSSGRSPRLDRPRWNPPACRVPEWAAFEAKPGVQQLSPDRLAALYRALRKALEDSKNEPGAADFYYGEMEMRRSSSNSSRSDRFLLWVYWLSSGYGLRASRALLAFAIVVPLFAIGFWLRGMDPPKGQPPIGYQTALLRSFESATSLLRAAPPGLNEVGQWLDAALRLIGATLLGLALFSLRGRIKR